jgi:hypothetical protein
MYFAVLFKAMKSSGFDMENTHLQDLARMKSFFFVW